MAKRQLEVSINDRKAIPLRYKIIYQKAYALEETDFKNT